jgi:hypothetical protein
VATVVVFVIGPRWCWGEKLVYWWLSLANVRGGGGGSGRDREKQRERIVGWGRKNQGMLIFCQL